MKLNFDGHNIKLLISLVIGVASFVSAYQLLTNYSQHTVAYVTFDGRFAPGGTAHIQVVNREGARKLDIVNIPRNKSTAPITIGTQSLNFSTHEMFIAFHAPHDADLSIPIEIHRIRIIRPYLGTLTIGSQQLSNYFDSNDFMPETKSAFLFDSQRRSAELRLKQPFETQVRPLYALLAAIIGIGIYLLISSTEWAKFPAFRDLSLGTTVSSSHEFDTINGLRGLAALLVLFSHAAPGFFAVQIGLTLLFLFSGFLLSKPFVIDAKKIYRWQSFKVYLIKRLKRILPAYYLYVFIIFVIPLDLESAIRHFLFIEGRGHLWPMTQIFAFYMLLPLVLLLSCGAYLVHRVLPLLLLMAGIYFWQKYAMGWMPFYNGSYYHPFFLNAFLLGVLGAYIQYDVLRNLKRVGDFTARHRQSLALLAATVTFFTIAWSAPLRPPSAVLPYISQFHIKACLSLVIILLAINVRSAWYSALISNWLLRSIGIIGFSFYILHGFALDLVRHVQVHIMGMPVADERSWALTLFAFIVTYFLAVLSYSFIERPFFGYRHPSEPNK